MNTILAFVFALGITHDAGVNERHGQAQPAVTLTGSSDGAGFPGFPGGKGGQPGGTVLSVRADVSDEDFYEYCNDVMENVKSGTYTPPDNDEFTPVDCIEFFVKSAESGQPGRGGDGGGFPGLPGGKGGAGGAPGADGDDRAYKDGLYLYRLETMNRSRHSDGAGFPGLPGGKGGASGDEYEPNDCYTFFAEPGETGEPGRSGADAYGYKRPGSDGPSISGGIGGEGGRSGGGPGGASGGAGGAGVGGGVGGKGGAGGSGY